MNTPVKPGEKLTFSATEAVRLLRSNLEFALADVAGCRVVGITGALRGEGRTTTAVHLARSLAESGKKVLLLDADLRGGQAAARLGLPADKGLVQVLRGEMRPEDTVCSGEAGLYTLAAGGTSDDPAAMLDSPAMADLMNTLRERFDYILMDLPPVTLVPDALSAARFTDGLLVVVRRTQTHRKQLEDALRRLNGQRVKVLGFVLNG